MPQAPFAELTLFHTVNLKFIITFKSAEYFKGAFIFLPDDHFNPFPKQQISDSSKMKELTDDNFKFDTNGRKFSKWVEKMVGKGEISHSVFKRLVLQTHKKQGLFGKGFNPLPQNASF